VIGKNQNGSGLVSNLASAEDLIIVRGMQTVTRKELAVVEKKIDALKLVGKEIKKAEKELADLIKRMEPLKKSRRDIVGTLTDNPVSREADESRIGQTEPVG
jgi:hypothetical protein